MTVLSVMAGIQKINMTELSCIAGLDNQIIACTRSRTSISWWVILFRPEPWVWHAVRRWSVCKRMLKDRKRPYLRHSPRSGIGLKSTEGGPLAARCRSAIVNPFETFFTRVQSHLM